MVTPVRWLELSDYERACFGNGCGPAWFPDWLTALFFGWFFEASCRRHDFGYARGGNSRDRLRVDVGFLFSMWRDVALDTLAVRPFLFVLSVVFFILVRLFGWWRFNYAVYLSKQQLLAIYL